MSGQSYLSKGSLEYLPCVKILDIFVLCTKLRLPRQCMHYGSLTQSLQEGHGERYRFNALCARCAIFEAIDDLVSNSHRGRQGTLH